VRILTVGNRYPPWSLGGYEVVWSAAVEWLRQAGHQVRVLTTRPDPSDRPYGDPPPPQVYRELRWYWRNHDFPPIGLRAAARLEQANAAVLARHLSELAPDAIVWWGMGGMSLSLVEQARLAGVGAIASVGDEWLGYGPRVDGWSGRWRGWLSPAAPVAARVVGVPARAHLDRAASWRFTSQYLLDAARADGWRLVDAGVLPHGVDRTRFIPTPSEPWQWRLLYCGRIDPRKGIETAIRALPHLPNQTTLTICGTGDPTHQAELAELAARLGVGVQVQFREANHREVPGLYAACDAVVFPVRWREPWGLVPLEAMSVGRPVAATRAGGGPEEYLREGENCLRFGVDDGADLAAALRRLAEDEPLRCRLVAAGHETAARFSAQAFHIGLERELERVSG
jgi:glycogen(starch) synthase